jgi:protein-S-isoprenylcysteine O-methyltransferase Ste14
MGISIKSAWLVLGQMVCLVWLVFTGPVFPQNLLAWVFFSLGWVIFFLGLKALSRSKISVFPEPPKGAQLVVKGIYRYVRHPFYAALLLLAMALLINHFNVARLIVCFCLLAILIIKLHFEEALLLKQFPEYEAYKKKSWRLIPQLY